MSKVPEVTSGSNAVFFRDSMIKGQPARIQCVEVNGQVFELHGRVLRIACLEDEWYEDLKDPEAAIEAFRRCSDLGVDLFSFWQRLPNSHPQYGFHRESESIAALRISTYDDWWNNQIKSRIRTTIRKAEKDGIVVRETGYDDEFVRGMTAIFNESPVRQGRRFWHYGKDFQTVKEQFSRFVHRESMIGAYLGDEMIGFVMLGNAGQYALLGQIISSLHYREKSPNNALIAKAVEVSAREGFGHLVYWYWGSDSLTEFKRRCGFEQVDLPRYFIPISRKGRVALRMGLHRGWAAQVPPGVKATLKRWRTGWNEKRAKK